MTTDIKNWKFSSNEELCEKIDEILLQFFGTLSDFYAEQHQLEEQMKSGHLAMSRARYSMGVNSVGIQQCDKARMEALYKVTVTEDSNTLVLDRVTDLHLDAEGTDTETDTVADVNKSGLRKRNINKDEGDGDGQVVEDIGKMSLNDGVEDIVEESDRKSKKIFDPVKWFGLLVPQTLRQSQTDFQKSLELAVSVANLKQKLNLYREQYVALLQRKKLEFLK